MLSIRTKKESRNQITSILQDYQAIANQNPTKLRLAIPSKEMWRFFIDGIRQEIGRQLKARFTIQNHPKFFGLYSKSPLNYTIIDYITEVEKVKHPSELHKSKLLQKLKSLKWKIYSEELSQLKLIDLFNMDKAWIPFERREQGYLKSMITGFNLIFDMSTPLTLNFIKNIHKVVMRDVDDTSYYKYNDPITGEFRSSYPGINFILTARNSSARGLSEFLFSIAQDDINQSSNLRYLSKPINNNCQDNFFLIMPSIIFPIIQHIKKSSVNHSYSDDELCDLFISCVYCHDKFPLGEIPITDAAFLRKLIANDTIEKLATYLHQEIRKDSYDVHYRSFQPKNTNNELNKQMQYHLDRYEANISSAKDSLEKLDAIVTLIQSCEQQHPYQDGNCRIFCMLLLNHLLLRNGFPLAILDDPNRFDMYGKKELVQEVIRGMENTLKLIRTGVLYHIRTDEVLSYLNSKEIFQQEVAYFNNVVRIEEENRGVVRKECSKQI